uniref:Uncharacterized protein n=1 Tax=Panagrolaimus sp. PS1159 TaxID=55785 RepID=A0AC35G4L8_9BILA
MTMDTVVVVVDDADVVVQPRQNCIVKHDRRLDTNQEKFERKIRLNKNVSVISKVHVQYFKVFVLPKLICTFTNVLYETYFHDYRFSCNLSFSFFFPKILIFFDIVLSSPTEDMVVFFLSTITVFKVIDFH